MGEKRAIIPNMFTMTNLIIGFVAIVYASKGTKEMIALAGILIFVSSIFDFLDGSVARALKVTNPIGAELDSLADSISYGIAPGFIAYQAFLRDLPEIGLVVAIIFPLCAVYRLARFNIGTEEGGFSGLPSPPAGIIVSIIPVLAVTELPFFGNASVVFPAKLYIPLYVLVALLMVSNVDYRKLFSDILKMGKAPSVITLFVMIALLFFLRAWAIFGVTALYIVIGLVVYIARLFRHQDARK